jgi:hypothetical protein
LGTTLEGLLKSRSNCHDRQLEAVADSRFGENISRLVRFWFNLFSELINDDVQILHFVAIIRSPHSLENVAVRYGHVRVCYQVLKNLEFFEPQTYIVSVDEDVVTSEIDLDSIKGDDPRAFLR